MVKATLDYSQQWFEENILQVLQQKETALGRFAGDVRSHQRSLRIRRTTLPARGLDYGRSKRYVPGAGEGEVAGFYWGDRNPTHTVGPRCRSSATKR